MTKRTKTEQEQWDAAFEEVVEAIADLGYPGEFGAVIAKSLGSVSTMERMAGYLRRMRPTSAEEIADEMLAIIADRDRWVEKKQNEFYNEKYNEWLYSEERWELQAEAEAEDEAEAETEEDEHKEPFEKE